MDAFKEDISLFMGQSQFQNMAYKPSCSSTSWTPSASFSWSDKTNKKHYTANPVLGKSLCSDWFFLGQDFAVRTVSMETVQSVYFYFGSKPANLQPRQRKKCENCHSSHWNYQQKLKDWNFSEISKMDEHDEHFLSASHGKCILLSGTECHIINYLLTELARAAPGNISPRSFSHRTRCARANIPQYGPRARLVSGY